MDSHDEARAHWAGTCLLSEEEKEEIRSLGIDKYEKERKRRMRRSRPAVGVAVLGFMGALVLVGLVMTNNLENFTRWLGLSSDEAVHEVAQDQTNETIDLDQGLLPSESPPSKADHSRDLAVEGGKQAGQGLRGARQDSVQGAAPPDTTRLENRAQDAHLFETLGED
jgi:hypothetical protein